MFTALYPGLYIFSRRVYNSYDYGHRPWMPPLLYTLYYLKAWNLIIYRAYYHPRYEYTNMTLLVLCTLGPYLKGSK